MTTLLNLLLIQLILVFIIDLSGASTSLKLFISKWLTKGRVPSTNYDLKPFTCSLCMTWWIGLIYIYLVGEFTIPMIAYVGGLSYLTSVSKDALLLVKDLITKVINIIYKLV